MTTILNLANAQDETEQEKLKQFKSDIRYGFSQPKKKILTKYLYDERGSELFNQITRHPDYYLTRAEIEVIHTHKKQISACIGAEAFNLVELGPGEGVKTEILTDTFQQAGQDFAYFPIDISESYLQIILKNFQKNNSKIAATAIHADYFSGLEWLHHNSSRRNVVLFLGSSIGNFNAEETRHFLQHLRANLNPGDLVLIGFDLCKNINVLLRAYNDSDGITSEFNFNLLQRINRELGANFNLNKFMHYPTYNVYNNAMESYLISLEEQVLTIAALDQTFKLGAHEPIHIEYSHKYLMRHIEELAHTSGFTIKQNFSDANDYFVDSLWCASS